MTAPRIVFSHANGFPAGTYRVLFEAWRAAGFEVAAIERLGHDPSYPVSSNWPRLRDQLLDFIAAQGAAPVWLVGHSLGGMLSLLAACWRPGVARGLVLLDSPPVTGWRAHSLHVAKRTGLVNRFSPGRVSARRRHHWADRAAVLAHFQAKSAFARWDPRVLADYVRCGFDDTADGVRLGFDRAVETRIYDTLPHHFASVLRRHPLRAPLAFVGGTRSEELRMAGTTAARRLAGERFVWMDGSHLFPMERPDDTAAEVLRQIAGMS